MTSSWLERERDREDRFADVHLRCDQRAGDADHDQDHDQSRPPHRSPRRSSSTTPREPGLELLDPRVVGDHVGRPPRLLLLRELAAGARLELRGPARTRALGAQAIRGDDRDRRVEGGFHPGLEQEGHLNHCERGLRFQPVPPGDDSLADQRMQRSLEPGQLLRPLEDDPRDLRAVDGAVRRGVGSPPLDQEVADAIAREQLVDDGVGGEGRGPEPAEGGERLGLAGGDRAGQSHHRRLARGGHRAVLSWVRWARRCRPRRRRRSLRPPRRRWSPRPHPRRSSLDDILGGGRLLDDLLRWRQRVGGLGHGRRVGGGGSLGGGLGRGRLGEDLLGEVEVRDPGLGRRRGVVAGLQLGRDQVSKRKVVVALGALDAQRDPAALLVDLEDPDPGLLPGLDDLARRLDVMLGELGDVHQALDPGDDLDERAEGDDLGHLALEDVVRLVLVEDRLPRVLLGLLEPERDPLAVAVDVEHLDPHRLADRQDLGRMVDVAPGELGDVDQAVDALEVDESAEVDDVRDLALDDHAGLQAAEDLLADLLALLLQHRAAREDDVVARAVELDHLALERLALELVQVVDAADVDQRGGQEAAHPEVEDETALDDLDHAALDRLAGLRGGLDLAPGLLEPGALLREDEATLLVLLGEHQGVDLLAERDLLGGVDRTPDRKLVRRDDALGLVSDVDQDLVLVDPHDLPADHIALLEGLDRGVVVGNDLAVDLHQEVGGAAVGRRGGRCCRWRRRLAGRLRSSVGRCLGRRHEA